MKMRKILIPVLCFAFTQSFACNDKVSCQQVVNASASTLEFDTQREIAVININERQRQLAELLLLQQKLRDDAYAGTPTFVGDGTLKYIAMQSEVDNARMLVESAFGEYNMIAVKGQQLKQALMFLERTR
jgi:hypothetical protein